MARQTSYSNLPQDEHPCISGAWAAHPKIKKEVANHLLFGTEGGRSESERHSLALASYDFKEDTFSEPKTLLLESSPPQKIAVHPKGDGVIVSFELGCKLFTWKEPSGPEAKSAKEVEMMLEPSEAVLSGLEDVGRQSCLRFSDDGSLLASAGEDGHVRVFQWPSMEVVIAVPKALKSVKDLDISLDNGFLAATGDNTPCLVWDLSSSEVVATIEPNSGERLGFSRFSRHEKKAFLFITVTKDKRGFIGVWDMTNWKRIGVKKFVAVPITSFAVSHHGRRLAMGTRNGDLFIVEIDKMKLQQILRDVHGETVTSLEFSPNDKVLLSLSSDRSYRVTALDLSKEWKEWQIWLVLIGMFLLSILLFYMLYAFGDSFFQIPAGRREYDRQQRLARQMKQGHINLGSHEEF